jgi:hypothetical protein
MSEPGSPPASGVQAQTNVWLHCSACRKDIPFQSIYWVCSVSTCNRARTNLLFCSVACWDSHLSSLRHRDAWAVEERAPTRAEWLASRADAAPTHRTEAPTASLRVGSLAPAPRVLVTAAPASTSAPTAVPLAAPTPVLLSKEFERDILIVVSKMKKYIKDRSGMNTSDAVAEGLGDHVRAVCDQAIHAAAADGRKTVLDRDVPPVIRR